MLNSEGIEALPTVAEYDPGEILPTEGLFVGRCWLPANLAANRIAGPGVVTIRDGQVVDLSERFRTFSELLNAPNPVSAVESCRGRPVGSWQKVARDSLFHHRARSLETESQAVLLSPPDLSSIKACGVTFIHSLLERVVEERSKGDRSLAADVRSIILDTIGEDLSKVKPGSPATLELKSRLVAAGMWSQYLEVGIGPDAEVFTKAQPMSAVGYGAEVGILPRSTWNNPEPEIVLAVSSRGEIRGATLGNDVNLRDFEGRSALLLGEAKDQNASCAIGPMVRLFDERFTLETVEKCEVELTLFGADGFCVRGVNSIHQISRSPRDLVAQVCGKHHQYPDGFMLFLGTMFAPTEERGTEGAGFTHKIGDRVEISVEEIGKLVNWVNHTDAIPPWTYGLNALLDFLLQSERKAALLPR